MNELFDETARAIDWDPDLIRRLIPCARIAEERFGGVSEETMWVVAQERVPELTHEQFLAVWRCFVAWAAEHGHQPFSMH